MTVTRPFGVSRRESHNADGFYARGLAPAKFTSDTIVALVDRASLDVIFSHSSESMRELPDNSVALMVTSPPTRRTWLTLGVNGWRS